MCCFFLPFTSLKVLQVASATIQNFATKVFTFSSFEIVIASLLNSSYIIRAFLVYVSRSHLIHIEIVIVLPPIVVAAGILYLTNEFSLINSNALLLVAGPIIEFTLKYTEFSPSITKVCFGNKHLSLTEIYYLTF